MLVLTIFGDTEKFMFRFGFDGKNQNQNET